MGAELWPRLKNTFSGDGKSKKKKHQHHEQHQHQHQKQRPKKCSSRSRKVNPYAASGLEKFAALLEEMEELQAKKAASSSLVGRTGASVSAARSLSRSAQEGTANTLARTASRRFVDTKESVILTKSPELVLLHCAVQSSDAHTTSLDFTDNLSSAEPRFQVHELPEPENVGAHVATVSKSGSTIVGDLRRDLEESSEERQSLRNDSTIPEVSPSCTVLRLPLKTSSTGRCMTKVRSLKRPGSWRQTSNSALVVLVALGVFISTRFSKLRSPLAAALTFTAVIRIWRKGKLYARLLLSSAAVYFLTPLRSYLTIQVPRRLSLLPYNLTLISDTLISTQQLNTSPDEASQKAEAEAEAETVTAVQSEVPGAPLSILLPIPEISAAAPEALATGSTPATDPPRRLAKRLTSRFKKLKKLKPFRSSPVLVSSVSDQSGSSSEPGSTLSSPSSHSSGSSSLKCPLSRRQLHKEIHSEVLHSDEGSTSTSTRTSGERKSSGSRKCCKKLSSRLGAVSSTETLEHENGEATVVISGNENASTTSGCGSLAVLEASGGSDGSKTVVWPVVGLFVALLFLLVGRFPAIVATSLFLVVVSNAHHDRAHHHRGRGRDTRASEAARKLHTSPPRGRRAVGSPPRAEVSVPELWKRRN